MLIVAMSHVQKIIAVATFHSLLIVYHMISEVSPVIDEISEFGISVYCYGLVITLC